MTFDDFAGQCCRSLAENHLTLMDPDVIHLIGLQRLADEIATTFQFDTANTTDRHVMSDHIGLSVKAMKARLHDLHRGFPTNNQLSRESPL